MEIDDTKTLKDRTLYIHPMSRGGARMVAAVYRSIGIDAKVLPHSDLKTLELGNMYSSGEECLPEKITLGDYLKITEMEGFDPRNTAFLMPTSNGPCRFGQYSPLLGEVLGKLGLNEVMIVSPSSKNGYGGFDGNQIPFYRSIWIGFIVSDILRKMLLKIRPYEKIKGTTDRVYEKGLERSEKILENTGIKFNRRLELLREELSRKKPV